jgi:sporulation protein YlmC with PRC-barrel domain
MAIDKLDQSRISEGTLSRSPQSTSRADIPESSTVSRDDVRDGFAEGQRESQVPRGDKRHRRVLTAGTLTGDRVRNGAGEDLGKIEEIMIDIPTGRVAYAVLSHGGFLGIGDKLFAVPWSALEVDEFEHRFVLDVDTKTLENAPGFDKNNWPDMADPSFGESIHQHWGQTPYWEHDMTDAGDYVGDERIKGRSIDYESTKSYRAGDTPNDRF